jgi:hypothetical protein
MSTLTAKDTQPADWRRMALPLSILLNLFLLAVIGGHLLSNPVRDSQAPLAAAPLWRSLANIESRLSPADRAAFKSVLAREAPRYAADSRRLLDARLELARQISAEHLDRDATKRALVAWSASWDTFLQSFSDPLVDALAQVSAEGRRDLVLAAHAADQRREQRLGVPGP